ncbi:MAG TPA: hypothetical protein VN521_03910 [Negativicutes bacterium]|nr:hypothetical protein [Negativicutes bacterium]
MDYGLAITAARLSLGVAILAPGYYLLRTLFLVLQRRGLSPEATQRLRQTVAYSRLSHPYIASLLVITPLYHIYVMWMAHPLGLKVVLGMVTAAAVLFMAATGLRLKGQPSAMAVRRLHRTGFFVLAVVLAGHRLV